jgi:glyoxylase-like metal-dependent hydrolase (beta-lactamase superfamily II)
VCALFTGDCVLGCGTTVFDDLFDYMQSLSALQALLEHHHHTTTAAADVVIYPGHGPVVADGLAKVKEYIQHRTGRENQLLEVMRDEGMKNVSSHLHSYLHIYAHTYIQIYVYSHTSNIYTPINKLTHLCIHSAY